LVRESFALLGIIFSDSTSAATIRSRTTEASIVYRFSEFLSSPDVALRGLYRRMAEKELNLFEFSSGCVAEARAELEQILFLSGTLPWCAFRRVFCHW
jgi:hypothetical protein